MAYEGQPGSAFVDLEIVQQHMTAATEYVAQSTARSFREGNEGALRYMPSLQFDSPLEVLFWVWWNAAVPDDNHPGFSLLGQRDVAVGDQRYRVDFLIEPNEQRVSASPAWKPIAVELDGHAFHERTREQVTIRDRRDRALQQAGWRVFHFSYGEFTNTPLDCVAEVFLFARDQWIGSGGRVGETAY